MADDVISVANDLGVPASPDTPAPMGYVEASARRDEMINDPAIRDKIMSGDIQTNVEWQRVMAGLAQGQAPQPAAPDSIEGLVNWAQEISGGSLSPELVDYHLVKGTPVSPQERQMAEARKSAKLRDPGFRKRYMDGDSDARREILLCDVIISSRIRT